MSALRNGRYRFAITCIVTILWVLVGYSLAFSEGSDFIGGLSNVLLAGVTLDSVNSLAATIPETVFVTYQMTFAIITVALVSGAVADRVKFGAWVLFTVLWGILVYFPVAGWVFSFDGFTGEHGGWIANWLGALDFAGGTAIHINAGISGLALALVLGPRIGFGTKPMRPHNMTLVMLGAALLSSPPERFDADPALRAGPARPPWAARLRS